MTELNSARDESTDNYANTEKTEKTKEPETLKIENKPSIKANAKKELQNRRAQEKKEQQAANVLISQEANLSRTKGRAKSSCAGLSEALLKNLVHKNKGNPKLQLVQFLEATRMPSLNGRKREVSDKTRADFGVNMMLAITLSKSLGMPIHNLNEFSVKLVIKLVEHWVAEDKAPGTIQSRLSVYRKFFALIGKESVLPKKEAFYAMLARKGIDVGNLRRTLAAKKSKAWSPNEVDFDKVYDEIKAMDEYVASQLRLQRAYGLRLNEVVHSKPNRNSGSDGLWVIDGAKGGLERFIPNSSDQARAIEQSAALEEAKILAAKHPRGLLIGKGKTMKQAKKHYGYILQKCGVTKKGLGVTGHGLRHEFAGNLYEEVSGLRPPVEGMHTAQEYENQPDVVNKADLTVSRLLGHARPSISGAYVGSRFQLESTQMSREARILLNNVVGILEQDSVAKIFREFGADIAWLTGKLAMGETLKGNQHMEVTVRMKTEDDGYEGMVQRFEALEERLNQELRREVVLKSWPKKSDPDPAKDGFVRVFGW